jgi:hypothetical protein
MEAEKQNELERRRQRKNELHVDGTSIPNLTEKLSKNNKTGVKGVSWSKEKMKWVAQIGFKGKTIYLGRFDDINDAIQARKEAEERLFKPMLEEI